jgi:hypothetical protein
MNMSGTYRWLDDRTIEMQIFGPPASFTVSFSGDVLTLTPHNGGGSQSFRRVR